MTRSIDDAFINAYRPDDDGDNLTPNTGRSYRPRRVTLKQGFLASVLGRQDWYIDEPTAQGGSDAQPPAAQQPRTSSAAEAPAPMYAWYEEPEIVASMPAVQVLFHDILTTDSPTHPDAAADESASDVEALAEPASAPRRTPASSQTEIPVTEIPATEIPASKIAASAAAAPEIAAGHAAEPEVDNEAATDSSADLLVQDVSVDQALASNGRVPADAPTADEAVEEQAPADEATVEVGDDEDSASPEIFRIDNASPTPPPPFNADWEVDCFHWPAVCRNLQKLCADALQEAGDQLTAAASDGLATLMVTSACRGEGRSTMALCIAKAAAESGSRVAVVDADLDHPQLAEYLNVRLQQDWRQSVFDGGRLEDAAIMSIDDRLTLVPLMRDYRGMGQSLSDVRVAQMLGRLASEFDLVVIDAGPIGLAERLLHPSNDAVDAVIVVRDQRSTTEEEVQRCVTAIRERGVQAVGIAENFGGKPIAAS